MCAALTALAACSDDVFEPTVDCDGAIGVIFIDLQPPPAGTFADYAIDVGDSIRVSAALRRVDASDEVFNPQQGWSCSTTASSPVAGTVAFSTTDTQLVALTSGGWIKGLQFGTALVTASSTSPAATQQFSVLVRAP
jgi:hypothetical protein